MASERYTVGPCASLGPERQCRECNDAAMRCLESGQPARAFEMLQQAMQHAQRLPALQQQDQWQRDRQQHSRHATGSEHWLAVTYNNLACYYQRQGKPQAALHYLNLASDLEQGSFGAASRTQRPDKGPGLEPGQADLDSALPTSGTDGDVAGAGADGDGAAGADDRASTLLNLSTVLSGLGRYEGALGHVEDALGLLCQALTTAVRGKCVDAGAAGAGVGAGAAAAPPTAQSHGEGADEEGAWGEGEVGADRRALTPRLLEGVLARQRPPPTTLMAGAHQAAKPPRRGDPSNGASERRLAKAASAGASSSSSRTSAHVDGNATDRTGSGGVEDDVRWVWAALRAAPTSRASLVCMCLYNRGVVLEHMRRDSEALRAYRAAAAAAAALLGRGSTLAGTFNKALQVRAGLSIL